MKVKAARIYLVSIGSLHPILLELITDDNVVGLGEAAIAYGLGATAAAGMIKDLVEAILPGRDPFRIEETWTDMYDHSFWAKGGGPLVFAGISAIEQALWDIKAKALNVPIYDLLGGKFRDQVPVYANGWSYECLTADDYARAVARPLREGYRALKCYPLATPNQRGGIRHVSRRTVDRSFANLAFEKVRALREAAGREIEIMVDLSGGLTTDETIRLCHRLEDLNILFIEEPADPFDLGALKKISDHVEIPIALGERIYTRYGFRPILEAHAADILQPDIGNTGGIMEAKKIAAFAEAYNVRIQPHICGSPVATAFALQLDACIANFMVQELYPFRSSELFSLVDQAPELQVKNGTLDIPNRPGLGVNLVPERISPFLWAECALQQ
ncbi:MAG: mandelate racemase/muconate lactonizing enzyme family protein [Candidatus Binataceae bacterium]|nr:mandelate racemase/muconate lactonizing enzyme family protein [Candidatus Binataceae bacterium]